MNIKAPQQLSSAAADVVRAIAPLQQAATPCNTVQQNQRNDRSKPPPDTSSPTQPVATPSNAVQQKTRISKTNPRRPSDALSPRQLLTARMLTQGYTVAEVASHLKLDRTCVWRWTRKRVFQDELRRLHDTIATATATSRALRQARQEVRDMQLMMQTRRYLGLPPMLQEEITP